MNHQFTWMRGDFDPIQIEIDLLKSKLCDARRSGDHVTESLVLSNLRSLTNYKATG